MKDLKRTSPTSQSPGELAAAIELAYGLLWQVDVDKRTKAGELTSRARVALREQLDREGQRRGITAARELGPRQATPHETHNQDAGAIVAAIVRPTLEAGGAMTDVLVLLESVVVGVSLVAIKLGGDELVLDKLLEGAKARLAEIRLGRIEPAGQA